MELSRAFIKITFLSIMWYHKESYLKGRKVTDGSVVDSGTNESLNGFTRKSILVGLAIGVPSGILLFLAMMRG